MRKSGIAVLAFALVLALGGISTGTSGSNRATLTCKFYVQYQRAQVDPILSPGKQVSAHSHDFYGRQDISDFMFARAPWPPIAGHEDDPGYVPLPSSCQTYGDWAAYWFPTPKFNGSTIASGGMEETWQGTDVAVPPWGMAYVAGNSAATSEANESPHVRFTCGSLNGPGSASPIACATGTVTAELTYPDCWDGQDRIADSWSVPAGINPSHFSYAAAGACPSGSVRMAQLVTRQHFIDPRTGTAMTDPFTASGTLGLSFASGPYYTYHGDFLNTWNIGLTWIVNGCLNQTRACPPVT